MLWIRSEKTLWKASFRRREITDVIPLLFFLQRGAILLSGNAPIIKITLWGLSTPKNAPFLGAIYPQKRCTFANVVGSYAITVPPTCLQSRPTHPVKSAFYTILLRFSWDIGICSFTTPLTANKKARAPRVYSMVLLLFYLHRPPQAEGMSERSDEIPVRDLTTKFYAFHFAQIHFF